MSKPSRLFSLTFTLLAILAATPNSHGQQTEAFVRIDPERPAVVTMRVEPIRGRNLSFLRSLAGVEGLAARISNPKLFDGANHEISYRELMRGEYLADADFGSVT